jgi:hypothetical protein
MTLETENNAEKKKKKKKKKGKIRQRIEITLSNKRGSSSRIMRRCKEFFEMTRLKYDKSCPDSEINSRSFKQSRSS